MIPKIIHISWKTKHFLLTSQNPLVLNGVKQLRDRNPTWDFQISDDDDVNEYLKTHLWEDDWLNLKDKHIVEKVDVWRLLKMVREGGCYTDIDRYSNISLDDAIRPGTEIVLPIHRNIDFSQDLMIGAKGHPIYKTALDLNLKRRREGCTDIMSLGPITYFHACTQYFLGQHLQRGQGMDQLKYMIARDLRVMTYVETHSKDTFLYVPLLTPWKEGDGKDMCAFYEESDVRHWTVNHPHDMMNKPYGS